MALTYTVQIKNKVIKSVEKMPDFEKKKFVQLLDDLKEKGPNLNYWKNFSKIGHEKYHCHLSYKWVACWTYSLFLK